MATIGSLSRSITRRISLPNFINRYFRGVGVDIGGKPDPLALYQELFSNMKTIYTWDMEDGDAMSMEGIQDDTFDFVHSSHCLEHLQNPKTAVENWIRILKPNGFLIVTIPDEDLYEQGFFPSKYNADHKWTFTILKKESWSPKSINVIELLNEFADDINIEKIELLNDTYRYNLPTYDQTVTPIGESSIEFVVQKRSDECKKNKGLLTKPTKVKQQIAEHLNMYIDDILTLNKIKIRKHKEKLEERRKEEERAKEDKTEN